jgi:hypothetical protein
LRLSGAHHTDDQSIASAMDKDTPCFCSLALLLVVSRSHMVIVVTKTKGRNRFL